MNRLLATLFVSAALVTSAVSQSFDPNGGIPVDDNVLIGKLENGLTYIIRKNQKPENRVQLRLVVNAGSMQENDDQLGLAHFVEHMAFNGSKNFEKNELVDFLQSVGVEFGADLNAYTSFEETVYMLPLPSDDEEVLMKGLTVLEDWASGLSFDPEEIDKERGVVVEEWRRGQGAQQRMRDEFFPILFKDSRYAERLPIGKKEIIENASYETIQSFYEDWYRPELMAIVVVGDIDVAQMESEIKSRFSKIKAATPAREKLSNEVPGHEETLVAITKDAENSFTILQLEYKHPGEQMTTLSDLRKNYLYSLYNRMLGNRLEELTQAADPPFIFASSNFGSLVRSTNSYSSFAVSSENGISKALETLVIENERVKKFGFTPSELERTLRTMATELENAAKEKDKTESGSYVREYVSHFLEQEPIPGIQFEFDFFQKIASTIRVEEINALATQWITDENRVVILMGVDKEGVSLPSEEDILTTIDQIDLDAIEPYDDAVSDAPLIDNLPAAGAVVSTTSNETVDIQELTLANGVKIVVKVTDFKNDEILMSAFSHGGHSLYPDEEYRSASYASAIVGQSGLKDFSMIELQKMLAGKEVRVNPYISSTREGLSGSSTPKDFETMLQLTHLYFTAPRQDEEVYASIINREKQILQNLLINPQYYYQDQVSKIMAQGNPRGGGFPTVDDLDQVSFSRAHEIYKERFSNAGEFTFFFVGNLDMATAVPMFEQYLGSLPASDATESWKDLGIRPPEAKVEKDLFKGTDDKSLVTIKFVGSESFTKKQQYLFGAFADVLDNRLTKILREEAGGVYSVRVGSGVGRIPYENYELTISFPCAPDNVQKLVDAAFAEIESIQKDGPSEEDVTKVQEADNQNREENLKRNNFWAGQLSAYYINDKDLDGFYEYEELVNGLNAEDIKDVANEFIDTNEYIKVILYPESAKN